MSFILDALRKAEHGRQATPADSVAIHTDAVPAPPPDTRRRILTGIALVGSALIVALVLFWLRQPQAEVAAAPATAKPAAAPEQTGAAPPPQLASAPPVSRKEPVRDLDREAARAAPRPAAPAPAATTEAPARRRGGTVTIAPPEDSVADTDIPAAAAAAAVQRAQPAAASDLPDYKNLLLNGRINLPNLNLDMHVYNRVPAKRFVFVNMKKYREGDRVEDKATLEEIIPGGAVLRHNGMLFVLRPD